MCAGALVQARIQLLVYAARDPKAGAVDSRLRLLASPYLNHSVSIVSGVLEQESSLLLKNFFKARRTKT